MEDYTVTYYIHMPELHVLDFYYRCTKKDGSSCGCDKDRFDLDNHTYELVLVQEIPDDAIEIPKGLQFTLFALCKWWNKHWQETL